MILKNRIVATPTGDDFEEKALGGAALVIAGHAIVEPGRSSFASPEEPYPFAKYEREATRKKVLKIHKGGAKASIEIFHAGQDARTVDYAKGPSGFIRPDGVEVKLTAKSINIRGFLFFFILFLIGSYLFVYVWDEPSSYSAGRLLGTSVKGISSPQVMLCIFLLLVFYILIQAGILYWFSGKDKKLLHWHFDWTGVGFSLTRPIPLKFYRVSLLLPGILLGVMPAIHGFCTGEANIFFLGLFGILGGTGDFLFWYSLRAFDDEDLLLAGKKAFQATIIKRNYGKND